MLLIGGVTTTRRIHPAEDPHLSPIFTWRRTYAETTGKPWFVLSTRYGLVAPGEAVKAYRKGGTEMNAAEWRSWAQRVLRDLDAKAGSLAGRTVEFHAGNKYRHPDLMAGLAKRGAQVHVPLKHMRTGHQIAWYKQHLGEAASLIASSA